MTTTPMHEGQHLTGESGSSYLVVSPLGGPPRPGTTNNVWSAVDDETHSNVYIVKQPASDDYFTQSSSSYPLFRSEMIMQELFKDCPYIRRQIDRIPPRRNSADPPRIILEPTECTLWDARSRRGLSGEEIRTIMREVLIGLREIHSKGLVYADLKMQNIFLNGFHPSRASSKLHTMIGDLGIVMEPAIGKVQPLAYRAPEVHFKSLITPAADIWGWGIIYVHLLQAQLDQNSPGIYDLRDLDTLGVGTGVEGQLTAVEAEQKVRARISDDFDLPSVPFYNDCILPHGHLRANEKNWSERLREQGVSPDAIDFLTYVLKPSPKERLTAHKILQHAWFSPKNPQPSSLPNSSLHPSAAILPRTTSSDAIKRPTPVSSRSDPNNLIRLGVGDIYIPSLKRDSAASSLAPTPAATPGSGPAPLPKPSPLSQLQNPAASAATSTTSTSTAQPSTDTGSSYKPWEYSPALKTSASDELRSITKEPPSATVSPVRRPPSPALEEMAGISSTSTPTEGGERKSPALPIRRQSTKRAHPSFDMTTKPETKRPDTRDCQEDSAPAWSYQRPEQVQAQSYDPPPKDDQGHGWVTSMYSPFASTTSTAPAAPPVQGDTGPGWSYQRPAEGLLDIPNTKVIPTGFRESLRSGNGSGLAAERPPLGKTLGETERDDGKGF